MKPHLANFLLLLPLVAQAADPDALPPLAPAYPELPPSFWEQHGTLVLIGGGALIALATLTVWKLLQPKPVVVLPPEVAARAALAKRLRQPEDGKLLSEVSQILRCYVVTAFELPPAEMTTAEFCAALAASEKTGPELAGSLANFLRECDARKFSPAAIAAPFNSVERARELIALSEMRRSSVERASARAGAAGSSSAPPHHPPVQ